MAKIVNQDQAFEAFARGATANDLVKTGVSKSSAYKWKKIYDAGHPKDVVEEVADPPRITAPTDPPKPGEKKKGSISEETGGLILSAIFGAWAMFAQDDLCYLTPGELATLRAPFAQTLRTIPNPVADAINSYAPPATFVIELIQIVNKKQTQRKERDDRARSGFGVPGAGAASRVVDLPEVVPIAPDGDVAGNGRVTGVAEPDEPAFRFGG